MKEQNKNWLMWKESLKNMTNITLRNPLGVTFNRNLFHSNNYGTIYCKDVNVINNKTFYIYKYFIMNPHEIVYERSDILLHKRKQKHVSILTNNNEIIYVDLHTFNERKYDIMSLNVIAFDFVIDEINDKVRWITVNNKNMVFFYDGENINKYHLTATNPVVDIHIIGNKHEQPYIIEYAENINANDLYFPSAHEYDASKIDKVFFLSCVNKWCVQCKTHFMIIDDYGCNRLLRNGLIDFIENIWDIENCMKYSIGLYCDSILFDKYETVVMYEYNRRLYLGETVYPFRLYCGEKLANIWSSRDRILEILLDTQNNLVKAMNSANEVYILSMFPMSLTASTRIATTLE